MNGQLFTHDFLIHGIAQTPVWKALDDASFAGFRHFARDLGCAGAPFKWDEEDRRHRMARLDALFFHLYGIGRDDAAYILDTFPIVREEDEKAHGRHLTKDLVLAYLNAVAAGDLESSVNI